MNTINLITDEALLTELGRRLAQTRLNQNQTQVQLAEQAGVSKRTVERLECGQSAQLSSFLRVCRVLGLLNRLDDLIPAPAVSPLAQVKLQGKQRRRASTAKPKTSSARWTWGDNS